MADLNYAGIVLPDGNSYQTAGEYVPYSSTVSTPISDVSVQNLAPEYDPTLTYSVKDWCVYNGVLYQCNTAIATPEAFDSTKWAAKKVADAIGRIREVRSGKATYSGLKGGGWADRVTVTITFDEPMPNATYTAFAMVNDAYSDFPFIRIFPFSRTVNGFVATCINQSGNSPAVDGEFDWIVIG